jgi:hypothetical protein
MQEMIMTGQYVCFESADKAVLKNFEIQGSMSHNYGERHYIDKFKGGIMGHLIDQVVAMMGRPEKITQFSKSAPGFPDNNKNNCLMIIEYHIQQ